MEIEYINIGNRQFLHIEGVCSIPVDRIKYFDWNARNGGASNGNSVKIVTDDDSEDWIFAYKNRDALAKFLGVD